MYVDLGGMRGGVGQKYREVELKFIRERETLLGDVSSGLCRVHVSHRK